MLAVHTSELEPLPHQIRAVYGELLPRTPLRFLLADGPGAGKTIMAGLYIKELFLRGDLSRCLIVAPGSLLDQWQEELLTALGRSEWDLVVVDEAHRMSAHYFGRELKTTRRYELGRMLGRLTRHLLLMTATPRAGKEEGCAGSRSGISSPSCAPPPTAARYGPPRSPTPPSSSPRLKGSSPGYTTSASSRLGSPQADIDYWYATRRVHQRQGVRGFLTWAIEHGHLPRHLTLHRVVIQTGTTITQACQAIGAPGVRGRRRTGQHQVVHW